jgi:hypothetical protein
MENGQWGHCKHCLHFGSPAAQPFGAEEAPCLNPSFRRFELRVYGSNGCRGWVARAGLPHTVEQGQPGLGMPS